MEVEDEHHVLTHAPKSSHSFKNSVHGLQKITNKFTFSKIYGQETNQKEFFNGTMLGIVKNFIEGQNCLVFSYGVTSSGKTYTIQGKKNEIRYSFSSTDFLALFYYKSSCCNANLLYELTFRTDGHFIF